MIISKGNVGFHQFTTDNNIIMQIDWQSRNESQIVQYNIQSKYKVSVYTIHTKYKHVVQAENDLTTYAMGSSDLNRERTATIQIPAQF